MNSHLSLPLPRSPTLSRSVSRPLHHGPVTAFPRNAAQFHSKVQKVGNKCQPSPLYLHGFAVALRNSWSGPVELPLITSPRDLSRFPGSPEGGGSGIDSSLAVEGAKTFLSLTRGLFQDPFHLYWLSQLASKSLFWFHPPPRWVYYSHLWGNVPYFLQASKPLYVCWVEIVKVSFHDQMVLESEPQALWTAPQRFLSRRRSDIIRGAAATYLKHRKRKKAMSSATMEMQWPRKFMITAIW